MFFNRILSVVLIAVLTGCSSSSESSLEAEPETQTTPDTQVDNDQSQATAASCDSTDVSVFCVSINGAEKTLYVLTEDSTSPLLYNPFMTSRFDTTGGITLAEVRFDITPTSFIKAMSVVFSGNTAGSYPMDGSGNFAGYTLAADQSWTFINGFSSGNIEITRYGAVEEFVTGTFSATLCDSSNAITNGSDCNDSAYLINLLGNFNIKRDADI